MPPDVVLVLGVFVSTVLVIVLAVEAGFRLGCAMFRRTKDEKESPVSVSAGAILGLSAFMLAFTFGIVSDRYSTKKELVRSEAAAIRIAWQRSDFLPETDRGEAARLLREYVDLRVRYATEGTLDPKQVAHVMAESQRSQNFLWNMAVSNARKDMDSDVAALYVESLNAMNSIHSTRVAVGMQTQVPIAIWIVLYCITIMGMGCVGYQTGIADSRRSMIWGVLAISFAMVFALIAALDRPDNIVMRVNQQPLIDLSNAMNAAGSPSQRR